MKCRHKPQFIADSRFPNQLC